MKTDRASDGAPLLEARVPFLDPLVTNLAFALPTRLKVRGLAKKVLLRKAVEPLLPREVVHGRKRGFSIPVRGLAPAASLRSRSPAPRCRRALWSARGSSSRRRSRGCSTSTSRAGKTGAASCGGCCLVHALVRSTCRAGSASTGVGADGGSRGMSGPLLSSRTARIRTDGAPPAARRRGAAWREDRDGRVAGGVRS